MGIIVTLDVVLAQKKMKGKELARLVGITEQNISILKSGRSRAIRLDTLEKICKQLKCQPGDILKYSEDSNLKISLLKEEIFK